jgi:acyl carrier protein
LTKEDVIARLADVFHAVFDDDSIVLTPQTTAADIEEWDSLNQIKIIVGAQSAFGVKLDARRIKDFQNVGQMVDYISEQLAAAG